MKKHIYIRKCEMLFGKINGNVKIMSIKNSNYSSEVRFLELSKNKLIYVIYDVIGFKNTSW